MANDLEGRVAALESEVSELRAREALRALRFRYHECINEGRWNDIPALFAEDCELDFGYLGRASGRDSVRRFFERGQQLLPFVKQFIHNHTLEVDADRATGFAYLEAKSVSEGTAYFVAGRYDDAYVRTGEGWLFARMNFTPYFTVPFHEGWAQKDLLQMGRR